MIEVERFPYQMRSEICLSCEGTIDDFEFELIDEFLFFPLQDNIDSMISTIAEACNE